MVKLSGYLLLIIASSCMVYMALGKTKCNGKYPHILMTCPKSRVLGDYIKITCEVISKSDWNISWQKDNTTLISGGFIRINPLSKNQDLFISLSLPQDSGNYTCTADNCYGRTSKSCLIKLKEYKRGNLIHNGIEMTGKYVYEDKVLVGTSINLTCTVQNKWHIYWMKDGIIIHPANRITINETSTIVFHSVKFKDSGNYTCHARTLSRNSASSSKYVTVVSSLPKAEKRSTGTQSKPRWLFFLIIILVNQASNN